jgi:lambda family phage portal protein
MSKKKNKRNKNPTDQILPSGRARREKLVNRGYSQEGASEDKRALKGFKADSGSPAEDIDYNNRTLRQRARILYMGAPIATSAIKTNRTNVIGTGLRLNPKINQDILGIDSKQAEAWERSVKAEFALWAEDKQCCDATGVNNFYGLQQVALMSWLMSGDVFALITREEATRQNPYTLRLHLIEADRVATPSSVLSSVYTEGKAGNGNKVHDGVEVDASGKIVAYHIRNTYPFQMVPENIEWTRVEAYGPKTGLPNILQVMHSERPDQYRGVTYLAPVIEQLQQIKRYTNSEIMAAVVESFFTAFVKTNADTSENPFNEAIPDDADAIRYDPNEYQMGPGQMNVMNPGEDIVFADPKRPASAFASFVASIAKQIGAALEIPVDLLLKEFNASYSASRAALLEAWKAFRMYRTWFIDDFCKPVYRIWMTEAVAIGRVQAPGFFTDPKVTAAWLGADWVGPSQGQLDPVKEISAEILAIQNGFTTYSDATARLNGGDWSANVGKLEQEKERSDGIISPQAAAQDERAADTNEDDQPVPDSEE